MRQWSCPARTGTLRFMVIDEQALSELDAEQLRQVSQRLLAELRHQRALNEKLAYECALLKRLKFAAKSERHSADQRNLLEDELDSDLAAVEHEIEQLRSAPAATDKQQPKRAPLPAHLPRREIQHEPTSTTCLCGCQLKRIGEDVAEKLDYVPGVFTVERHVRGKWACAKCQMRAVVYDFCESRAGEHARAFLGDWRGSLICDDYAGYKASFSLGVTEAGCLAHARRKFFDLHAANKSQIAEFALQQFAQVYEVEREEQSMAAPQRLQARQQHSRPTLDALHAWMVLQRQQVAGNSATAKALDYSLKRWAALTRFVDDPQLPPDNNWIENQIRPIALGRSNWLFAGSLRAGQRAAAVMSLIQSARMNGHDP